MTDTLSFGSESGFARRLLSQRRDRERLLGAELATDPAWTMLVALFIAYEEAQPADVTRLCVEAGAPPATALRWLEALASQGKVSWSTTSGEADRTRVVLTPEMANRLRELFGSWMAQ